ncbi:hypothetical protein E2C01_019201 [Portunus trituberculatus]|uniref:Uncharacterized protein n=1 Tax=Portunus trituberculatus TaxID=210409 RepID=A0A5B7DWY9_PORTR|nr:hypothetical protein [Portunus trituberculatus]
MQVILFTVVAIQTLLWCNYLESGYHGNI